MDSFSLLVIISGNLILAGVALFYLRRFREITLKHSQELTRVVENEKRKLSAMIASLTDGVMMIGSDGSMLVVNPALKHLLGITSGQSLSFMEVVAAVECGEDLEKAVTTALNRQTPVKLPEFTLGNYLLSVEVEPVKNNNDYLLGAVVVFRDLTEVKKLEGLREGFMAMMVHELRTPLTTITYAIDLIQDSTLSRKILNQNLQLIKSTAKQMLSLVGEFLDVSKIESGKFAIASKEDNLASVIEEEVKMIKPLIEGKGLSLVSEIDPSLPLLKFDRERLGQVLANLLSNAIKYTDRGKIEVAARAGEKEVTVSVSDSGDGIKKEDLSRLFSKFEQVGKGKTGQRSGTGLGLVVAKGIIKAHGGKIWAFSEGLGKGSTFSFTLPRS